MNTETAQKIHQLNRKIPFKIEKTESIDPSLKILNSLDESKQEKNLLINKGRWSKKEHNLFLFGIIKYGNNWKEIKNLIKSRSNAQARSHAQKFFLKLKDHKKFSFGPFVNIKQFINRVRHLTEGEKAKLLEELMMIPFDSEGCSEINVTKEDIISLQQHFNSKDINEHKEKFNTSIFPSAKEIPHENNLPSCELGLPILEEEKIALLRLINYNNLLQSSYLYGLESNFGYYNNFVNKIPVNMLWGNNITNILNDINLRNQCVNQNFN